MPEASIIKRALSEEKSRKERTVTEREKILIENFVKSRGTISIGRQKKYRLTLGVMARNLPRPLNEVTKDELSHYLQTGLDGYKDSVKCDYRHLAKIFYRKHRGDKFVSFIKVGNPKPPVTRDQLLTQDELQRLRNVCEDLRNKALIETLYEIAPRTSEFLSLKRSSIVFDEKGAYVSLQQSKTVVRPIRIVNAVPLLANWIENHPLKDRDAALWVDLSSNTRYEPLGQVGLNRLLKRLAFHAHIDKRIWAYLFRHTRITDLIRAGMNDATLRKFAGWTPRSTAPSHYAHLVAEDVDAAILQLHGIKIGPSLQLPTPKTCVRCGTQVSFDAETCQKCGMALTVQAAIKLGEEARSKDEKIRTDLEWLTNEVLALRAQLDVAEKQKIFSKGPASTSMTRQELADLEAQGYVDHG